MNIDIINTKYANNIDIIWSINKYWLIEYFYFQFNISKFNVTHIDFEIQLKNNSKLLYKMQKNEDLRKECENITSTSISYYNYSMIDNLENINSLLDIFSNLKEI